MHVLAVNSVSTLLNYLSEQLQNTPVLADIQGWNQPRDETQDGKEEEVRVCNRYKLILMIFRVIDSNHVHFCVKVRLVGLEVCSWIDNLLVRDSIPGDVDYTS